MRLGTRLNGTLQFKLDRMHLQPLAAPPALGWSPSCGGGGSCAWSDRMHPQPLAGLPAARGGPVVTHMVISCTQTTNKKQTNDNVQSISVYHYLH